MNHDMIELAFIAVAALALLTQAIILLAIYSGMSKAVKSLKQDFEDMKSSVLPTAEKTRDLVEKSRTLVERVSPKLESTVTDLSELAHLLRTQVTDVEAAVEQILERVRQQSNRIDGMFSGTLDAVDKASGFVTNAVSKPVRQLSGVLAALKAVIESLRTYDSSYQGAHDERGIRDDQNLFI
ncbi:MAG TPA: hypothetical protein VGG56_15945 [Terracidiphilus sp.]|jgi:uncharacterized protein YoxC